MAESKDAALTLKIMLGVSFKENSKIFDDYVSHNADMWTNLIKPTMLKGWFTHIHIYKWEPILHVRQLYDVMSTYVKAT